FRRYRAPPPHDLFSPAPARGASARVGVPMQQIAGRMDRGQAKQEVGMARAIWDGVVLAENDRTINVDGYTYFPAMSVRWERLKPSSKTSVCGWKGTASYWDVEVDGKRNAQAAWQYLEPKPEARVVKDM